MRAWRLFSYKKNLILKQHVLPKPVLGIDRKETNFFTVKNFQLTGSF